MNVNLINDNIICFVAHNTYEVTSTFVRMGEFYESPYPSINGGFFTLDEFMDVYAANNGNELNYFNEWEGYNFPGESLLKFKKQFHGDFSYKEDYVISTIEKYVDITIPFYVIATVDDLALNHEYAHAQYYLNARYRSQCDDVYSDMSDYARNAMHKYLISYGYNEFTFADETQAYLGTNSNSDMIQAFRVPEIISYIPAIKSYRRIFNELPNMVVTPLGL